MKYALVMYVLGVGELPAPLERQLSYPMCLMRMSEGVEPWRHVAMANKPWLWPRDVGDAGLMCVLEPAWHSPQSEAREMMGDAR